MHRWAAIQMATLGCAMLILAACARTQTPATAIHETTGSTVPAPTAVSAAETGSGRAPTATSSATSTRPTAGLRMYVDPVSGEMREPTDAELAAEATAPAAISPATVKSGAARAVIGTDETDSETVLPGGIVEMRNDHRADVQERVCEQPDGTLSSRCPPQLAPTGKKARKP
jgi:hypothetical protein